MEIQRMDAQQVIRLHMRLTHVLCHRRAVCVCAQKAEARVRELSEELLLVRRTVAENQLVIDRLRDELRLSASEVLHSHSCRLPAATRLL